MLLYRDGSSIYEVEIDEQTIFSQTLMGEEKIVSSFISKQDLGLKLGDYILLNSKVYEIVGEYLKQQLSNNLFKYEIEFFSETYKLYNSIIKHIGRTKFSYFGTPLELLTLIVSNMGSGWYVGAAPVLEPQLFEFKDMSCRVALSDIAQKFQLEYYVSGQSIYLTQSVGTLKGVSLGYGKNQGAYDITRQSTSSSFATVWYCFGGSQNLPAGYRDGQDRLTLNTPIEVNVSQYGRKEGVVELDYIYPHRIATITNIVTATTVIDSTLDFNLNEQEVKDGKAKIVFQSGELNGQEFFITSFNSDSKEITFQVNKDDSGYELPNATFSVAVGDRYSFIGITMPSNYITAAETELYNACIDYANQNSRPQFTININVDEKYIRENSYTYALDVGDNITISAPKLNYSGLIRIQSISYPVVNPNKINLTLSNTVNYSVSEQLIKNSKEQHKSIISLKKGYNGLKLKLGWKTTQELLNMTFDPDGYFDMQRIKPLSVETSMLVVGAKSQQFLLEVIMEPNYNSNPNVFKYSNGILVHGTIEETIRTWNLNGETVNILDNNSRYIYAKCNKVNFNDAKIELSTEQIKPNDNGVYYYFWVGVLHSVMEGVRWISLTYGTTSINGRFIKTGRVQSFDGSTYFDLDESVIAGKIKFINSNGNYIPLESFNEDMLAFVNEIYPENQSNLTSQIDGKIETWFYGYVPISSNFPASEWTTNVLKNKHIDDLFFNTVTGIAYRYKLDGETYSWEQVRDTGITKALEDASKAQDTADGKRRVFISTPYSPYDIGDLWANGTFLRKCIHPKVEGQLYSELDWDLATSYDNTQTVIDGGLITTGTLQVAGDDGAIKAGITGGETGDESVRFWAGASFLQKMVAPFRVLQNGVLYSKNSFIEGFIKATSGMFGFLKIDDNRIVNDGFDSDAHIVLRKDSEGSFSAFGTNVLPATSGGARANARFSQTGANLSANYAAIFSAAGSSTDNIAILVEEGRAVMNEATINGRSTLTRSLTSTNLLVDVSQYDLINIEPLGAGNSGVTFQGTVFAGKEVSVINLNMGKAMFIYNSIRDYTAVTIPAGGAVTCKYTGAYWYVTGQNF